MATKTAPPPIISTSGRGLAGTSSGAIGPGGTTKTGIKPNTKVGAKPNTTRFTNRIAPTTTDSSSVMIEKRGQGSMTVIFLVSSVCLGLLALGIALVYIGDQKYIVDVMVLGALCIVMGITFFVFGMLFTFRPLHLERKRMEEMEQPVSAAAELVALSGDHSGSVSVLDPMAVPSTSSSCKPVHGTDMSHQPESIIAFAPTTTATTTSHKPAKKPPKPCGHAPSPSSLSELAPDSSTSQDCEGGDTRMYDRGSLQTPLHGQGKLTASPSPLLAQLLDRDRSASTPSVLSADTDMVDNDDGSVAVCTGGKRSLDDDIRAVL